MNKLLENFETIMPLNRKERFFTGTVLPAIICYNKFKYINRFFELIDGFDHELQIISEANNNNILIQTEYSFKESLVESHFIEKFAGKYETKDTPDLVILITEPEYILFVGEAKMFSSANPGDINTQMNNQRWFIDALQKGLNIRETNCFHFTLLPEKLIPAKTSINYPVVFWEEIINAYSDIMDNDYFLNVLRMAIKKFDTLRSKYSSNSISFGKNMDSKLSGEKICELHSEGKKFWVGRFGGKDGQKFKSDIDNGNWKNFEYEININSKFAPNANWFSSDEFMKATTIYKSQTETIMNNSNQSNSKSVTENNVINLGDWHFSHLGREYFLHVSRLLNLGGKWDSPIDIIYIGKKGVPYIEKKRGREVNPNWSVILNDGRQIRFKNNSNGLPEKGLWERSNCHIFKWEEIKTFFENQMKHH